MEQTMEAADPMTLAAAFRDQAQRTEDGCRASSRFNPVGKGIPIAKPAGKISSTATAIFKGWGHPTAVETSGETSAAIAATSRTTAASVSDIFGCDSPTSLRLQKLPMPLDSSIENITTVMA